MLGSVAYCIYFERKIAAWIQDRYGPTEWGRGGFAADCRRGQFLLKEDIIPDQWTSRSTFSRRR